MPYYIHTTLSINNLQESHFLHSSTFNAPLLVITMFIYYFCKKLLHNPIFEIVK